jgi:sigma-B regulation protein RsbU (phosphoserine phosphatase)
MIHSLFRVVSRKEESPSQILGALNNQLCAGDDNNMFVTCFVGCLDLYTGKLNYANAGHDKPFLLTSSASLLPVKANLPLGVFPDTQFELQSMQLSPGSTLFLYTDGLTEAKNKFRQALGRERVQQVLDYSMSIGADTPEELVSALSAEARTFAGDCPQSDDLTLLCIRFQPGDTLSENITLGNNKEEVAALSDFVKHFLGQIEMERRVAAGLRLALEEVVVNVMNYAYPPGEHGEVTVYADSNYKEVRFTVVDSGFPFDPTAVLSVDTTLDAQNRPIGGLGIHLTRKMVDSVSYSRKHGFNVLTLTKSIS